MVWDNSLKNRDGLCAIGQQSENRDGLCAIGQQSENRDGLCAIGQQSEMDCFLPELRRPGTAPPVFGSDSMNCVHQTQ